MDWMPLIGRRQTVEQEALRILVLVGQLGQPESPGPEVVFHGESQLQAADHLVRHPATLAMLSTATFRARPEPKRRQGSMEAIRRALATLTTPHDGDSRFPVLFEVETFTWHRLDDALAFLATRDLLTVYPTTHSGKTTLSYRLEGGGARLLGSRSVREDPALARIRTRCRVLRESPLPQDSSGAPRPWIPEDLISLADQLHSFRQDEQIDFDEDLLARFFQSTFDEPL